MEEDTKSPVAKRGLRELQAERHNAFLLMDIAALSQIAMEATIRVDRAIATNDQDNLDAYRALMQGAQSDLIQLRKDT